MIIDLFKESDIVNLVEKITKSQIRTDIPEFKVGDTVDVGYKIKEGKRERVQNYQGLVVAIKGSGVSKNFVVRHQSGNVGVERTFPINSPLIDTVKVVRRGHVRRAKLNYLKALDREPKIKEGN